MKVKTLVNLYQELNNPNGLISCKLPLGQKVTLMNLFDDLKPTVTLFLKEEEAIIKELDIKSENGIISQDTPVDVIQKFNELRNSVLEESIDFNTSKYKFSVEKFLELEIVDFPFTFIKIFILQDLTNL